MFPSIGQDILYRLPDKFTGVERWRPAKVTEVLNVANSSPLSSPFYMANLVVTLDGPSDSDIDCDDGADPRFPVHTIWRGSVAEGTDIGCWRHRPDLLLPEASVDRVPQNGDRLEVCLRLLDGTVVSRPGFASFAGDMAPCASILLEMDDRPDLSSVNATEKDLVPGRTLYGYSLNPADPDQPNTPGTWRWPQS
ncbi:MAG: hypothetical protein ACI8RZ_000776 [Myxococcota bacterium]|jgi:hypothetical protein